MKGMNDMIRQAQVMQRKMSAAQDALKLKIVEASSGGGMVTVKVSGSQNLTSASAPLPPSTSSRPRLPPNSIGLPVMTAAL